MAAVPAAKVDLLDIKRRLLTARFETIRASEVARRLGDVRLSNRLRNMDSAFAAEIDYVDGLLGQLPWEPPR